MYDAWTPAQRTQLVNWINTNGLAKGVAAYPTNPFWTTATGNWNCVCTSGLLMGALAISDVDTTGNAARIIALTVPNAKAYCAQAIANDGTWSVADARERADPWQARDARLLVLRHHRPHDHHDELDLGHGLGPGLPDGQSVAQSDRSLPHVWHRLRREGAPSAYGPTLTSQFNWGDCGPNKYTATSNALLLYGNLLNNPVYSLYQRDRMDARNGDPFAMMFYQPLSNGTWWDNLPLDHYFSASQRSGSAR